MNDFEFYEVRRQTLNGQICRLRVKIHRLRKSAESHREKKNIPMQKACLAKIKLFESLIKKMQNSLIEKVIFT